MTKRVVLRWIALMIAITPAVSLATTYNSPTVDDGVPPSLDQDTGTNVGDPSWGDDEVLASDPVGDSAWGPFNDLQAVWVTWDANGVYFSVTGALWDTGSGVGANSVNLYIDIDYGRGTGIGDLSEIDPEALGAITRNFWRPLTVGGGFGCDWGFTSWSGRFDLGFLDITDLMAPVNLFEGVNDAQSVNTHTSAEGVIESRDLAGNSGYELFVPWDVFYPAAGPGRVPAGTQIAVAVAQVGGGDSLSPESMPDGADDRALDGALVFTVDSDGNGVPDEEWPPSGTISGTVSLDDPTDVTSVIEVFALLDGTEVARTATPAGGGAYTLTRLGPGTYQVGIENPQYLADPRTVVLAENEDRTGVDFLAEKVTSGLDFEVVFVDGPDAVTRTVDVHYTLRNTSDGEVYSEGVLGVSDALAVQLFPVRPDDYELEIEAISPDPLIAEFTGYAPVRVPAVVIEDQITDLGSVSVALVVPTRLAFHEYVPDGYGGSIRVLRIPGSIPDENFFVRSSIDVVALDAEGNEALLDVASRDQIQMSLTAIDPRFPVRGRVDYWQLGDDSTPAATAGDGPALSALTPGETRRTRAAFRVSGTTRQVARLRAFGSGLTTANLEVQIVPRLATTIQLATDSQTLIAGESTPLRAQLLDVTNTPIAAEGIAVSFSVTPNAGGSARVTPAEAPTDAAGAVGALGDVAFSSTLADTFTVVATAYNGLDDISSEEIEIVVLPGAPDHLELSPSVSGIDRVTAGVAVTDAFGNPVAVTPRSIAVGAGPDELIASAPSTVDIGADGTGSFDIELAPGLTGVLQIDANDPTLPTPGVSVDLRLLPGLAAFDEPAPETDPAHNALPGADLTALAVRIQGDDLVFTIPFASDWNGIHLSLLVETQNNGAGAFSDPFGFPISYAHPELPDYIFTYKYSANDYGDLRRPGASPGQWEWYNWDDGSWPGEFQDGVNAIAAGRMTKTATEARFTVPIDVIAPGLRPGLDTIRVQAAVMQEEGDKRPALDSVPHDATVDMEPPTGDWFDPGNLQPVTLSQYAVATPMAAGDALRIDEVVFSPDTTSQGETVIVSVAPRFEGTPPSNPVFQVFADLSALGGGDLVRMNDAGRNGDAAAGDGIWSVSFTVPATQFQGAADVVVQALELTTSQSFFATGSIEVIGEPDLVPLLTAVDAEGDDHGPNQPGVDFLYYEYPTNGVFFDGVFDLRRLDVFEIEKPAPDPGQLLFRVTIGDLTDPNETSAADWNATYPSDTSDCPEGQFTDLNLQNVVILIDSQDGVNTGSAELPDNRWADVAPQDAWEYAIVFDGWWKGLIKSNGTSSAGGWSVLPSDDAFFFCASDETNTIDGYVDKSQFTAAELEAIDSWDIIVLLSGHDGDSNPGNWGGVRWVNDGISEWQFGGGRNGEDGRERDPNIIDLLAIPGLGPGGQPKTPGRSQEDQLNYLTDVARRRFADDRNIPSVEIEATGLVDLLPPTVRVRGISTERAVVPNAILADSPVVVRADISDQTGVGSARLYWWTVGESEEDRREVPMGRLRGDLDPTATEWVADLRWEDIAAATATGPLVDPENLADQVRYILVTVDAVDIVGNSTTAQPDRDPVVLELPVSPTTEIIYPDLLGAGEEEILVDLNEGSQWSISAEDLRASIPEGVDQVDLVLRTINRQDVVQGMRDSGNATVLGRNNRYLGMARRLELRAITGPDTTSITRLANKARLSLHFPRYAQAGEHPGEYSLFHLNEQTDRWILASGHGEEGGSTVTVRTRALGSFAVFTSPTDIDVEKFVTGLVITPNPFSPNNDGLYDEVDISYVLPEQTNWAIVEVFDVRGERVRLLQKFRPDDVTNRTLGLTWDGRDDGGRLVPMGIYVVRVEVQSKSNGRVERATKAVAVVR